jgi:hypothetical protein
VQRAHIDLPSISKGHAAAWMEGGAKFTTGWRNNGWREAMARVAAAARGNIPRGTTINKAKQRDLVNS